MKLQDVEHKHPPFDVAAGLAASLLATGKCVKFVKPEPPKLFANTKWVTRRGPRVEDYEHAPEIVYSCSSCGNRGHMTGPTAHRTQVFRHCHTVEAVPEDVRKRYAELRHNWEKTHKRRPAAHVHVPNFVPTSKPHELMASTIRTPFNLRTPHQSFRGVYGCRSLRDKSWWFGDSYAQARPGRS
jgi:hypothetical protein